MNPLEGYAVYYTVIKYTEYPLEGSQINLILIIIHLKNLLFLHPISKRFQEK